MATPYQDAARQVIHAMKYDGRPGLAKRLADLWMQLEPAPFDWKAYDAMVPVPLHRVRKAERGFNQAEVLARALTQRTGVPLRTRWLTRRKATEPLAR
ncbi:MAG: ComF family protein, partial [Candidatus Poribacteria bacterium]|nr:ComF family protein [Candidatus Poribacteria bacterium]